MSKYTSQMGSLLSDDYVLKMDVDVMIRYFIITNKSTESTVINVTMINGDTEIQVSPIDVTLQPRECYTDNNIVLMKDNIVKVKTTKPVDYLFSMEADV